MQAAYASYGRLIARGEEAIADQAALSEVLEELRLAGHKLGQARAGLREIGWAARGPSSHPGANEILALMAGLARQEPLEDALETVLERELDRVGLQLGDLGSLPDFIREPQQELLSELAEWLREMLQAPVDGTRDWEALGQELEQWASDYSSFDLDFMLRRYSAVPTAHPWVNFALNCRRLDLEELIPGEMVGYAIGRALATLAEEHESLQSEPRLNEADRQRHGEVTSEICRCLVGMPETDGLRELPRLAAWLGGAVTELIAIRRRAG